MTVESSTNRARYVGNGAMTVFPFSFIIPTEDELEVYYTNVAGTTVLLSSTQYTVTGLGDPNGGAITYFPSGVAIPATSVLLIQRTVPYTQPIDLVNQDGFYPEVVEEGLDNLEFQIQQLKSTQDRNLTVGITDTAPGDLPSAAERALKFLAFDANGNAIAGTPVNSAIVSSAMAPVVSAASLAAGRSALGLGTMATEGIGSGLQDDGAGNVRTKYPVVQDGGNQAVTVAFHATTRLATGALSYTCPRANTLFNGFGFWVAALTASVSILVDVNDNFAGMASGQTLVIPPGTQAFISTDAANAGIWSAAFTQLIGTDSPLNLRLNVDLLASAMTITVRAQNGNVPSATSPVLIAFRNPSVVDGGPIIRAVTSTLSMIVPATATLGTTSGQPFRLWVVAFDSGGAVVLGVILPTVQNSTVCLDESSPQNASAVAPGPGTAQGYYATAGVASRSMRILGYVEFSAGQATAGTWITSPSKIQVLTRGCKLPGDVIQRSRSVLTAVTTGSTALPEDDSVPQITEGDQYLSLPIRPISGINVLRINAKLQIANSGSNQVVAALFKDATANALCVGAASSGGTREAQPMIDYLILAGSTSLATYTVRAGASGNTNTVNGAGGTRLYGGVQESFIQIEELMT